MPPNQADGIEGFASAAKIVKDSWKLLLPAERISTANYAAKYRRLSNEGGGHVGPWSNAIAPYGVGIMDAFDDPEVSCVAIVGPGQSSKTALAENFLMKTIMTDPADTLWYMQTDDGMQSYVKSRIEPMIEDHDFLFDRLGKRESDNSIGFKKFAGMRVQFLSANRRNLINKSAGRIIADEIDNWNSEFGNAKGLLDVRRQTYGSASKLIMISHPDMATGKNPDNWTDGIMSVYRDSDRMCWWWACPLCQKWSSPTPIAQFYMELQYPETPIDQPLNRPYIEQEARLVCPHCSEGIEDHHRRAMVAGGKWVSAFQEMTPEGIALGEPPKNKNRGFWVVGPMSPFILGGIGGLASNLAQAYRDAERTANGASLKEVVVKQMGHTFEPLAGMKGSLDANTLAERTQHETQMRQGIVPIGVRFLVTSIDVQKDRFEVLVRGWGIGGESWIVNYFKIPADPAMNLSDWHKMLREAAKKYKLADQSGRTMRPRCIVFDSSGAPGVTQMAYTAWKQWKRDNTARVMAVMDGRDAWNIVAYKGYGTVAANSPKIRITYPDTQKNAKKAVAGGVVPVLYCHTNLLKDDLYGQLSVESGKWHIHLPPWMRDPEPPHRLFEQLVNSERRLPTGKWESLGNRNELMDLMTMNHAAAHLHGVAMLSWDNPPPWAQEWDSNALVEAAAPQEAPQPIDPNQPQAPPKSKFSDIIDRMG